MPEDPENLKARQSRHRQAQKEAGAAQINLWLSVEHEAGYQRLMQHHGLGRKSLLEYLIEQAVRRLDEQQPRPADSAAHSD